jgi:tyrosine-protein kinase Etk/Wzc
MIPVDYFPSNSLPVAPEVERGQLTAREMLNLMRDHIWEIVAATVVVFLLAVAYQLIATPIYSADVLVRVDPPEPNALGLALQTQEAMPTARMNCSVLRANYCSRAPSANRPKATAFRR